jgi:hypothetical protein
MLGRGFQFGADAQTATTQVRADLKLNTGVRYQGI